MGCSHPYLFWRLTPSHQQCITIEWVCWTTMNTNTYPNASRTATGRLWPTPINSDQGTHTHRMSATIHNQKESRAPPPWSPLNQPFNANTYDQKQHKAIQSPFVHPLHLSACRSTLSRNNYIHNISIGRYSKQTSSIDEYNSKHQSQSKTCCCLIDRQQSKTSCNKRRYWQSNQSRVKCIMER